MEYCNEIWKDVQGYEDLYQVSNLGRVRSVDRIAYRSDGIKMFRAGKVLKLRRKDNGYIVADLWKNNKGHGKYVHRLVAQAFVPNDYELPVIDHLNCVRDDNRPANLEWVTYSENNRRAAAIRVYSNKKDSSIIKRPENNGKTTRKVVQGKNIETGTVITFNSMRAAERKLGICNGSISQGIKHGWKYGGYEWSLVK